MDVAGDIVGISIPFTAGILAASAVPDGSGPQAIAAMACTAGIIASASVFCRKGRQDAAAYVLFLFTGAFCRLCAQTAGGFSLHSAYAAGVMDRFLEVIKESGFEQETTALLGALLTGRRELMGSDTVAMFRNSGASHILALSGLHLGLIYAIIRRPLALLGNSRTARMAASITAVAAAGFYTLMAGAGPSIVRAFLFILLNEILKHSPGRLRDPLHILCTALMIQLVLDPMVIDSMGFQLSYLAMLGIFVIFPVMRDWYPQGRHFDPFRKIWTSLALSTSCQLTTAPLIWLRYGTFPTYFLLTNLIALPLVELLITSGLACIGLEAAGVCPEMLKSPVDGLARTLLFCLETISSL